MKIFTWVGTGLFVVLTTLCIVVDKAGEKQMNENSVYSTNAEKPVVSTIVAGIKDRESNVEKVRAYLVREMYMSGDKKIYEAYQSQSQDSFIRASMKRLMKPPQLTMFFTASKENSLREDERNIVPADATYRLASYNGNVYHSWNANTSFAEELSEEGVRQLTHIASFMQLPAFKDALKISSLIDNNSLSFIGKEKIGGIETYKVEDKSNVQQSTITYWIAPSRNFLLMKKESRLSTQRLEKTEFASSRTVQVIDAITEANGVWIPKIVRQITYLGVRSEPKTERWGALTRVSIVSAQVNTYIPKTVFDIPFPPDTQVHRAEQETYKIKGDKAKFEADLAEAKKKGEQPDLDSIDLTEFKARIAKGQPLPEDLKDEPVQNLADDK